MFAPLLKLKIWSIERHLRDMLLARGIKPLVWSFGAYYIDPKYMVFVVGVLTDHEKNLLKNDALFQTEISTLSERFRWPKEARKYVNFNIESDETVQREAGGNWWHHYK